MTQNKSQDIDYLRKLALKCLKRLSPKEAIDLYIDINNRVQDEGQN
jgi:hypothetical protein|nr:MAG TPA: hypothetical protein [Caudoviricetes sp.]